MAGRLLSKEGGYDLAEAEKGKSEGRGIISIRGEKCPLESRKEDRVCMHSERMRKVGNIRDKGSQLKYVVNQRRTRTVKVSREPTGNLGSVDLRL